MVNHLEPNYIKKYDIYDILYNDNGELIIITPFKPNSYIINYITPDETLKFNLYKCPDKHTDIYSLKIEYAKNIKISINNDIVEAYVNTYPSFKDEIIFSTIVKNEDNYVKQWIDFHLNLGITRFIIYDNSETPDKKSTQSVEKTSNLPNLLEDYIKKDIVVLIKWPYPYREPIGGISGQTTQQNHSVYAFKDSKYIGMFDIDEYINMQESNNIHNFFEELIIKEKIDVNQIGSFRILNKFFYNPHNLRTDGNKFLNIFNCDKVRQIGQEKNFVLPKNVKIFCVHMISDGKPMYNVNPKYVFFNHYYFLNKSDRGKNITNLTDNSILRHIPK
jgi:hypothetical protein